VFLFLFFPGVSFAFTNNTIAPQITGTEISIALDASDVTRCTTSDPSFDRVTIERQLPSFAGSTYTDFLLSSVPGSISTTTVPSFGYIVYCSNASHDRNFGSDLLSLNTGYNDYSVSYPDSAIAYALISGSSTTTISTTTIQVIDNPTQDLFYLITLFMYGMVLMLWVFKKRN